MLEQMQTRDELYDYLSYHKYEKEMDDILNKKDADFIKLMQEEKKDVQNLQFKIIFNVKT